MKVSIIKVSTIKVSILKVSILKVSILKVSILEVSILKVSKWKIGRAEVRHSISALRVGKFRMSEGMNTELVLITGLDQNKRQSKSCWTALHERLIVL